MSVVTSQAIGVQVQFSSLGLKQVRARVNRRAALDKAGADRADKDPNPGLINMRSRVAYMLRSGRGRHVHVDISIPHKLEGLAIQPLDKQRVPTLFKQSPASMRVAELLSDLTTLRPEVCVRHLFHLLPTSPLA